MDTRRVGLVSSDREYGAVLRAAFESRGAAVRAADTPAELVDEPDVAVVGLFLAEVEDGPGLMAALRSAGKPVVVLAAGEARGEVSHAALRQAGAVVAEDTETFVDSALALLAYPGGPLPGGRAVRLELAGAADLVARGACEQAGLQPLTGGSEGGGPAIARDADQWQLRIGGQAVSFPSIERAVHAAAVVADYAERARAVTAPPSGAADQEVVPMTIEGAGIMDEHEAKRLLDRWGVPVVPGTLVTGPGRHEFTPIRKLATHFGFPVVLKAIHRDIVHKAEMGAVVAGIANIDQLKVAWEAMHQRFPDAAWLIQPFLPGDVEVLIAAKRDPVFGPVVMFGPGGVMSELYHDVSQRVAPLTEADALEMIEQTRASDLMRGFRGLPLHEPREVADVIVKVGQLMLGQPTVLEIDLNPLLLTEMGAIVVDAKALIG